MSEERGAQRLMQPVEEGRDWQLTLPLGGAAAVLGHEAQLPSLAWSFARAAPGLRLGYVQSAAAGDCAPEHAEEVDALRARGLLAGHITVGAARGGDAQARGTAGALDHGLRALGWDAAVCGAGVAAGEEGEHLGPSGLAALEAAQTALALGCATLLVPRMCSGRPGRGIYGDTLVVLDRLLGPVTVALPAGLRSPVGADLRAGLGAVFGARRASVPAQLELDVARPARIARHDWRRAPVELAQFAAAGLASAAAARGPSEDPLFYGAALAAGATLAELLGPHGGAHAAEHVEGAAV
jgi:hypothetical protein